MSDSFFAFVLSNCYLFFAASTNFLCNLNKLFIYFIAVILSEFKRLFHSSHFCSCMLNFFFSLFFLWRENKEKSIKKKRCTELIHIIIQKVEQECGHVATPCLCKRNWISNCYFSYVSAFIGITSPFIFPYLGICTNYTYMIDINLIISFTTYAISMEPLTLAMASLTFFSLSWQSACTGD